MDIRLVIVRIIVLVAVYSLVIGLPFLAVLRYPHARVLPLVITGCLASIGPFIYFFLEKKAADRIWKNRRRYQAKLIQASAGMGRVREIRKLLKLIVRIVIRVVRVEHGAVYYFDRSSGSFVLGAALSRSRPVVFPARFPALFPLAQEMTRHRRPVLIEDEIKKSPAGDLRVTPASGAQLSALNGVLIVPGMIESRLVAFLVLGSKVSGERFSPDDLSMFTVVANQSSTAIENALFYEEMKKTEAQLYKAEKMATIGTMADGLSHQVNNRLHAMGFIAGGMMDTLEVKKELFNTPELKDIEKEFIYALTRLQDNVARGGDIVQGLMKYSRKGEDGYSSCDIDRLLDCACEMAQFKIKVEQMNIVRRYDAVTIPRVSGNFTRLQEVFFNLIDNAYDATMLRKSSGLDPMYLPELVVSVESLEGGVRLVFADNGVGVTEQDRRKLFTPFFTTKASARKGTGLGLYVIRRIIEEDHGGRVEVDSAYMSGTRMILTLPGA